MLIYVDFDHDSCVLSLLFRRPPIIFVGGPSCFCGPDTQITWKKSHFVYCYYCVYLCLCLCLFWNSVMDRNGRFSGLDLAHGSPVDDHCLTRYFNKPTAVQNVCGLKMYLWRMWSIVNNETILFLNCCSPEAAQRSMRWRPLSRSPNLNH